MLWIAVQMLVLQRYFIMQPAIAAAGAIEMLLAWLWQRATATFNKPRFAGGAGGAPGARTLNPRIKSPLLCH